MAGKNLQEIGRIRAKIAVVPGPLSCPHVHTYVAVAHSLLQSEHNLKEVAGVTAQSVT